MRSAWSRSCASIPSSVRSTRTLRLTSRHSALRPMRCPGFAKDANSFSRAARARGPQARRRWVAACSLSASRAPVATCAPIGGQPGRDRLGRIHRARDCRERQPHQHLAAAAQRWWRRSPARPAFRRRTPRLQRRPFADLHREPRRFQLGAGRHHQRSSRTHPQGAEGGLPQPGWYDQCSPRRHGISRPRTKLLRRCYAARSNKGRSR